MPPTFTALTPPSSTRRRIVAMSPVSEDARPRIGAVLGQRGAASAAVWKWTSISGGTPMRYSSCSHSLRRDRVVDEHDEAEVERLPPTDDDLAVDEPVVDAVEHKRHAPASVHGDRGAPALGRVPRRLRRRLLRR